MMRSSVSSIHVVVHILCLAFYLIPLLSPHSGEAVLDELHIVSKDNPDTTTLNNDWTEVFYHDYWGRPMTFESSHQSWRPLTVLTFRLMQLDPVLFGHRLINIITHAATGHFVSILASLLFPGSDYVAPLAKVIFCLHPTHVEITANAANRNHLLAVLCSVVSSDPRLHIVTLAVFVVCGLLCSETFLFQTPAIIITMTVIVYKRNQYQKKGEFSKLLSPLLPRYVLVLLLSFIYLGGRFAFDTLSIPEGLIRPAENPFFEFKGTRRILNYSYILIVHVMKSLCLDVIGFSHEYGYNCIPELTTVWCPQVALVATVVLVGLFITYKTFKSGTTSFLLGLCYLSWLATLFPISGLVKVGTFVADRIVAASTVPFSIFMANWASAWVLDAKNLKSPKLNPAKALVVLLVLAFLWRRVHVRTLDWMDNVRLLSSSLKTCPESAKSNLELSKVYSGLYPEKLDLQYTRTLLEKAAQIDPNYCDIHKQMAQLEIQEQNYIKFEEHLVQSMMCPFTMQGSVGLWREYWQIALKDPNGGPAAKIRYDKYSQQLQQAIDDANNKNQP